MADPVSLFTPLLVLLAARSLKLAGAAEGGEYDMGSVGVDAAREWLASAVAGSRIRVELDQAGRLASAWLQAQPASPEREWLDRLEPHAHPEIATAVGSRAGDLDGGELHGAIMDVFLRAAPADEVNVRRRAASLYYEALLRALEGVSAVQPWAASRLADVRHQRTQDVVLAARDTRTIGAPAPTIEALLATGRVPLPVDPMPADLLRAEHELVGFVGRTDQLGELDAWADKASPAAVCLFTGPGGTGKTRLAVEWCRRLRERGAAAGFLGHNADVRDLGPLFTGTGLRVAVVDYAETRRELVLALLERMAEDAHADRPLRLLLLARGRGEWWDALGGERWDVRRLIAGRARDLAALLDSVPARVALFHEAVGRFKECVTDKVAVAGAPDLDAEHFGHPLFVQMAALAAVRGLDIRGTDELLDATLDHERSYWRRAVGDMGFTGERAREVRRLFERVVTVLTLWGGAESRAEATMAVSRAERTVSADLAGLADGLLDAVGSLYASSASGRWARGLEPDLLGEALVRRVGAASLDVMICAVEDVGEQRTASALRVLTRAAYNNVDGRGLLGRVLAGRLQSLFSAAMSVAIESGEPIGVVLAETLHKAAGPPALALAIARACPVRTVALMELAEVATRIAWQAAKAGGDGSVERRTARAQLANNLANRLSALGRREEALLAAQEATGILQELAADRPDAFWPDLAASLNDLGNMLSELGRREEALAAAHKATDLYRELATERPDAWPNLAVSLNNLGNRLSELGRREEALTAAREATDILRELATERPDAFRPNLAASLNNLGNRLSELGRREEALTAAREATGIRRELATERPDAFRPDLATSLHNLGAKFSEVGRREEALAAAQEATDLHRELAADRHDAFRPKLAASLSNLGAWLSEFGRREEAIVSAQEATDILRELATERPDAFRPNLAASLSNLGAWLSEVGRREESLAAAQEATEVHRELATERPGAFRPDLAKSLWALGRILAGLGRRDEARAAFEEGLRTITPLLAVHPQAFAALATGLARDYIAHADAPDEHVLATGAQALATLHDGPRRGRW
jgi:tetratricopeptide (TPR) repeat protein